MTGGWVVVAIGFLLVCLLANCTLKGGDVDGYIIWITDGWCSIYSRRSNLVQTSSIKGGSNGNRNNRWHYRFYYYFYAHRLVV